MYQDDQARDKNQVPNHCGRNIRKAGQSSSEQQNIFQTTGTPCKGKKREDKGQVIIVGSGEVIIDPTVTR
jgi:hypothetical protein